ncbi:DUF6602 domain-containing protein [Alteromonas gracilis]|uniref:DUF6602 domain-containing protein n=1 Tax=Alteromonas gracilis TaxID=1479524 RepID=UPI00373630DD
MSKPCELFDRGGNDNFKDVFVSQMEQSDRTSPRLIAKLKSMKSLISGDIESLKPVVRENPAMVGGTVEKTWSTIISTMIPFTDFEILNKVIIQFNDGTRSPEIDLVIVKDMPELADRNYVNYDFVVAAFEVKLNLKTSHLDKIFETSEILNKHKTSGTLKNELCRDVIFGVLAHTSSLSQAKVEDPSYHVSVSKREMDTLLEKVSLHKWEHPTDLVDLVVVNDAFSIGSLRTINYDEKFPCDWLPDVEVFYNPYLSSGSLALADIDIKDLIYVGTNNSVLGNFGYNLSKSLFNNELLDYKMVAFYEHYNNRFTQSVYGFDIEVLNQNSIEQLRNPNQLREY